MKTKKGVIISIVILYLLIIGIMGGGYYIYTKINSINDKIDNINNKIKKNNDVKEETDEEIYGTDTKSIQKTIYKEGTAIIVDLNKYTSKLGYTMLYNTKTFSVNYLNDTDTFTSSTSTMKMEITHIDKSIDEVEKENETFNPSKTNYGYTITYPNTFNTTYKVIHYYIKGKEDDTFKIAVCYPLNDWSSYFENMDPEINEYINSFEIIEK